MKRLSSTWTLVLKVLTPIVVIAYLCFFTLMMWWSSELRHWAMVAIFAFIVLVSAVVYSITLWPLFDRVDDAGDTLVLRRRGIETRLAFADCINVAQVPGYYRPFVILRLRKAWPFGDEVKFLPAGYWKWWRRNPVVEDLMLRIDAARRSAP